MSERGITNTWMDRTVQAIRKWLRKFMPNLHLSPAELRQLLVQSDRYLRSRESYRDRVARVQAHAFAAADRLPIRGFLNGSPVVSIARKQFTGGPGSLADRVARYYRRAVGGKARNPELGEVVLNRRAIKDSISHGIGADKADAFAAVPAIIEQGRVIDRQLPYKGREEDRFVIAAPFRMEGNDYVGAVVVRRDLNTQRFYLHEVALREKLREPFKTGASTSEHAAHTGGSGAIAMLLRDAVNGKLDDADRGHTERAFSVANDSVDTQQAVMQDQRDDRNAFTRARDWVKGHFEDMKPALLGALQTRHVLELMEKFEPLKGASKFAHINQRMEADRNSMLQGAPDAEKHPKDMLAKGVAPIQKTWRDWAYEKGLKGWLGRKTETGKETEAIMHKATQLGIDPDKDFERIQVEDERGQFVPCTRELINQKIRTQRNLMRSAPADDKSIHMDEVKRLRGIPKREHLRKEAWPDLKKRFDALPEDAKQTYREVRDWYRQHADATEQALIGRIEMMDLPETYRRSLADRIRFQFESARRDGVYFPLDRNGEFWISYSDASGAQGFVMLEHAHEFERAEAAIQRRGWTINGSGRKNATYQARKAPSGTFVKDIITHMKQAGVSEKVQDDIYQLFLKTLPEMSMRKRHIRRKGVPGFSDNAMRAFAKNGFHGSYQLARLRYSQRLEMLLEGMHANLDAWRGPDEWRGRGAAPAMQAAKADALLGELEKRHERIMNPTDSQLANRMTSIGFLYFLGASPASALVNFTQGAQVTLPMLGARHGWNKASRALARATTTALRTFGNVRKSLTDADELRAMMELEKRGDIDRTQAHTLAAVAEGNELAANPTWERVMRGVSWMFHKSEIVNREAAGLAAYRLARGEGKNFEEALNLLYSSGFVASGFQVVPGAVIATKERRRRSFTTSSTPRERAPRVVRPGARAVEC